MLSRAEPEIVRSVSLSGKKVVKAVVFLSAPKKFVVSGRGYFRSGRQLLRCLYQPSRPLLCEEGQLAIFLPPAKGASCGSPSERTQISC